MAKRRNVAIGLLGTTLDQGKYSKRWERWRPSVALCQHEDLLINRFELLYQLKYTGLAERIRRDVGQISPETEVRLQRVEFDDPWDFEEVYGALHDFAREYPFDPDREDYLINITTGSHVAQICLFLLAESHRMPGRIIQESPPPRSRRQEEGTYRIIDLYEHRSADGRMLRLAFDRVAPWARRPETFPYWKDDPGRLHGRTYVSYFEVLNARWPNPDASAMLEDLRPLTASHSAPQMTFTHGGPLDDDPYGLRGRRKL
ncbi:MAG: RNA repair transcriptional activator RtcR family protein [Planctomycetota bacterium]|jgi:hypothetical protein